MIIIYIDIILLVILLLLILFTCGYCTYRVHRLRQNGQVAILLKPTKVLFSHKKEGEAEQLRTVVAYHNPLTGDYCVHKSRAPRGYMNNIEYPDSPDSGVSDEYEPLNLVPPALDTNPPEIHQIQNPAKSPITPVYDNSVIKTWKWEYTEYQI
ncbi:uncharacterized protein LOC119836287 [Zerene cesonia]|uniref:uncharacterized protein LOC119836287 n=1 Tax=Zerene cesonia TaxID=33412 RepID=UPI0018E50C63|nr:uncharacterized protein LOC119836287 [Zerene cesonia]